MLTPDNFTYADPHSSLWSRILIQSIEKISGQPRLWRSYVRFQNDYQDTDNQNLWEVALNALKIDLDIKQPKEPNIPRHGPSMVIANHPYGVIDGLSIGKIVHDVRQDYKIITNSVLCRAEEVKDYLLPVDFSPTHEALETNIASRQAARLHLKKGGCLIIFGAGGVSTAHSYMNLRAWDNEWQPFIASLLKITDFPITPIYFHGQNSALFQISSQFSQTLRLSLFLYETARLINTSISVNIGDNIASSKLADLPKNDAVKALRESVYKVGHISDIPTPKDAYRIDIKKGRAR